MNWWVFVIMAGVACVDWFALALCQLAKLSDE